MGLRLHQKVSRLLALSVIQINHFSDPVQQRKEIRDLNTEEKWLYLQGLAKFQAQPVKDPLSYYQIAGRS